MKHLPLLLFLFLSFTAFSQTLDPLWLKQLASAQSGGTISNDEEVAVLCTDRFGNIYVGGKIQQNGLYDTTLVIPILSGENSYIAKFNCAGNLHWVKQFGASVGSDPPYSMEVKDSILLISLPYTSGTSSPFLIDSDTIFGDSPASFGELIIAYNLSGEFLYHWGNGNRYFTGTFPNLRFFEFELRGGSSFDPFRSDIFYRDY